MCIFFSFQPIWASRNVENLQAWRVVGPILKQSLAEALGERAQPSNCKVMEYFACDPSVNVRFNLHKKCMYFYHIATAGFMVYKTI